MLVALSQLPMVRRSADSSSCSSFFEGLKSNYPNYYELAATDVHVDRLDGAELAVVLAEPERLDDRVGAHDRVSVR